MAFMRLMMGREDMADGRRLADDGGGANDADDDGDKNGGTANGAISGNDEDGLMPPPLHETPPKEEDLRCMSSS